MGIYDPDPQAQILAGFEGFWSPEREDLLSASDVLVTATGARNVLSLADLVHLPHQAFLLNAGHSEQEICEEIRSRTNRETVLPHVERIDLSEEKSIFLLAGGRLLNLAAGFGDTINAFDLTTAQLIDALDYLLENGPGCQPGLQPIPYSFFSG